MGVTRGSVLAILMLAVVVSLADSRVLPTGGGLPGSYSLVKVFASFLSSTLAWRAGGRGLSLRDETLFALLFVFTFSGDLLFCLGQIEAGMGMFVVFHALLARRNLTGARQAIRHGRLRRAQAAWIAVAVALPLGLLWALLARCHPTTNLLIATAIYVVVLWVSLLGAVLASRIRYFPSGNVHLMLIGVILFALCDVTVGVTLLGAQHGPLARIASGLTWLFYAPALILIALSAWHRGTRPAVTLSKKRPVLRTNEPPP